MQRLFVIFGYGVPKNIRTDLNYQVYLRSIFNSIYQRVVDDGIQPTIVASGGPTDLFKPYRRTEGAEIIKELQRLRRNLPAGYRTGWTLKAERKSLSTLENMLFTRALVHRFRSVTIFCETTRVKRIRAFVRRVYRQPGIKVVGVDFDVSANRYLDPKTVTEKEREFAFFDAWALKSPKNMRRHHAIYVEKIRRLRRGWTSEQHVQAVRQWLTESIKEFRAIRRSE